MISVEEVCTRHGTSVAVIPRVNKACKHIPKDIENTKKYDTKYASHIPVRIPQSFSETGDTCGWQ